MLAQAGAGNPEDPDNLRSSWFTNPGAAATAAPVRSGVGKYIAAPALDAGSKGAGTAAAAAAATGDGAAEPASKKPKVVQKQPMMNFDAW